MVYSHAACELLNFRWWHRGQALWPCLEGAIKNAGYMYMKLCTDAGQQHIICSTVQEATDPGVEPLHRWLSQSSGERVVFRAVVYLVSSPEQVHLWREMKLWWHVELAVKELLKTVVGSHMTVTTCVLLESIAVTLGENVQVQVVNEQLSNGTS